MTAETIKELMKEHGLTRESFSKLLGISERTIDGWLSNSKDRRPPYATQLLIKSVLKK